MNQKYALAVNSVCIFIFAGLVTTILHEAAHFFTAIGFGLKAELHHNYVSYDDANISDFQKMCIAGAGPIVSLILGLIFLVLSEKTTEKGLLSLTLLWLGLQGTLAFAGYMMIAPFFTYGDTGKVFSLLGVSPYIVMAISITSIISIVIFFKKKAVEFSFYAESDAQTKKERANALFVWPIIIGGILTTLMHYPFPGLLSLLAPVMMPFTFFSTYGTFRRGDYDKPTVFMTRYSTAVIVLAVLSMVAFRLLVYGISL
jgi:hypothetical protein